MRQSSVTLSMFVVACLSLGVYGQDGRPPGFVKWLRPMNWQRDSDQPVFTIGKKGEFDSQHVLSPSVIFENGEYSMYYIGSPNDVIAQGLYKPATELTEEQKARIRRNPHKDRIYKIGLAKSKDGVHFTKHERSPVLSFGDDRKSLLTPNFLRHPDGSVLRENGKLVMYYTAADMPGDYKHHIYRSTSDDGFAWSAPSGILLENAYAPYLIKEGDTYKMWFVDVSKRPWVLKYAESGDGLKWTAEKEPCAVPLEQKWERGDHLVYPSVFKADGIYILLYGSVFNAPQFTAIGLAVSEDGKKWTKFEGNPVFQPEPKHEWESNFTTSQTIMRLPDGSYRLWYATRKKPDLAAAEWSNMYYAIGTARWQGPKP